MTDKETQSNSKKLTGTVVSADMDKTAAVVVGRFVKHPKYLKYIKKDKKHLVHDPEESASVGDTVVISETRPVSKKKRFRIEEVKEE